MWNAVAALAAARPEPFKETDNLIVTIFILIELFRLWIDSPYKWMSPIRFLLPDEGDFLQQLCLTIKAILTG